MLKPIIVGSRGSVLALTQSRMVIASLEALYPGSHFEIRQITTHGDRDHEHPLTALGGKGVFVKEIEEALLGRQIDLAVHSLKDLPTEQPAGLIIGAVLERADPRDVLVLPRSSPCALPSTEMSTLALNSLPIGSRVGTSSLRRAHQLRSLRLDLKTADIRGNVDTRLRKLDEGSYGAIVLAAAGLERLGLGDRITQFLDAEVFLPAPGQGALAIETRADDTAIQAMVAALDDAGTRLAVTAERAMLKGLGGGCDLPIGAYAHAKGASLVLHGVLADGERLLRAGAEGPATSAQELGQCLAEDILRQRSG